MEGKLILRNNETEILVGDRVSLGKDIIIGNGCKKIKIGYGSFIGDNVYIDATELEIGEYTTIHKNTTIHGYKKCTIGNNCWIGQNCIIDSIAGTTIGNNVGVGAYSQLWTHMRFGDVLGGCRWNSCAPLIIEDDVWFVGHCIVSPITAKKRSMLLVGGVITKDMEENHIYVGAPAKDVTFKMGTQFIEKDIVEKRAQFMELYQSFVRENGLKTDKFEIVIFNNFDEATNSTNDKTVFYLNERLYKPVRSEMEYRFIKYLLYDKAKFNPMEST